MEHGVGVEVPPGLPEIEKSDILGVAQEPGGLVIERFGALGQRPDPEGGADGGALPAEAGAGRRLDQRSSEGKGSQFVPTQYILVNWFTK